MNEKTFGIELRNLLECADEVEDSALRVRSTQTFEEGGVLTHDQGIVVRLKDGSSFYLTIQQKDAAPSDVEDEDDDDMDEYGNGDQYGAEDGISADD